MKASKAIGIISKGALRQIYIQELLEKGITDSKNGTKIGELDYYELRHEVFLVRSMETDIENGENKWF